jgi:uncharacterized glyoxalase superfamily protein PhnB
MRFNRLTPIVITEKLAESRDFYTQLFGFQLIYDSDWYVALRGEGDSSTELAFMLPDRPDQEAVFQPRYAGQGICYVFEVDDVDAEYERLQAAGIDIIIPLQDKPWGERHFTVQDPNGIPINVVQLIPPSEEYAAEYQAREQE